MDFRIVLGALAGSALLTVASPPGSAERTLPLDQQERWAEALAAAQERVDTARRRVEVREAAYSEARHERYPRGEDLARIEQGLAAARRELADARKALEELVEEGRQAGVLPGVLRPYW